MNRYRVICGLRSSISSKAIYGRCYLARNRGSKTSIFSGARFIGYLLTCFLSFSVSAYTTTWTSRDDPTWYYSATLSDPQFVKVAATQEGLPFNDGATPVTLSYCNMGASGLYDGNLFVWCRFKTGDSKVTELNTKPYAHWYYLEQPSPFDSYWTGTRLLGFQSTLHFGPGFEPSELNNTSFREGDRVTFYRVWTSGNTWSGKDLGGHIIYLSLEAIEADMFGKKFRSQNRLTQRLQMTDPVNAGGACCDNGIYQQSFNYDITLQRYPLLVTLPSHVDMGQLAVGADSESHIIPVSVSANNNPVAIVPGVANIEFSQLKPLTSSSGNTTCDAKLVVSNENGQVNPDTAVDLYSFRDGITTKITNTSECMSGNYSGALAFTVSWK